MTIHHPMCEASTPFGAPMVAPPALKDEAEEVHQFLKSVRAKEPAVSMADLWVLASMYALSSLGGPLTLTKWGNREASSEELDIRPAVIQETLTDINQFKKILCDQGFPLQEIAAMMGHRTVGYHHFQLWTLPGATSAEANPAYPEKRKCTADPLVFDNQYFINLTEKGWKPNKLKIPSHEILEHRASGKQQPANVGKSMPFLPFWRKGPQEEEVTVYTCDDPSITMLPIDIGLLTDPLLRGWVVRLAENEIKFFNSYEAVLHRIHLKGYHAADM
jgi:catalase (peroxidase I)